MEHLIAREGDREVLPLVLAQLVYPLLALLERFGLRHVVHNNGAVRVAPVLLRERLVLWTEIKLVQSARGRGAGIGTCSAPARGVR